MSEKLKKEDYEEPRCLLDMKDTKNHSLNIQRFIKTLDQCYAKDDMEGALSILNFWYNEAKSFNDDEALLSILNERMGYFRKQGLRDLAQNTITEAYEVLNRIGDFKSTFFGTTYVNMATVYKCFDMAQVALPLYKKARDIYEKNLCENDPLLAGLYNNMALALVDLNEFEEALALYNHAIKILSTHPSEHLDIAITYLNMADLYNKLLDPIDASNIIDDLLKKASDLLDKKLEQNMGYYAFVCEKCAPTFSYYGYFLYAQILKERAKRIYEGN